MAKKKRASKKAGEQSTNTKAAFLKRLRALSPDQLTEILPYLFEVLTRIEDLPSSDDCAELTFRYVANIDLWITDQKFMDQSIEVRLYCHQEADLSRYATKAMFDVQSNWELIKEALTAELHPRYLNHTDGELKPDAFFEKLLLETIDYDTPDSVYTLYLSDSGVFGGHGIQLIWAPGKKFQVDISLVG